MTPRLLSLIVACALLALGSTARADERDEPARCLSAYGSTACGFHCLSAYGEVRCARTAAGACLAAYGQLTCWDPPRAARRSRAAAGRCVAAYGAIACGYGCVAAYGEVRCAQTPHGTCSAAYGQLTCWDPPPRERAPSRRLTSAARATTCARLRAMRTLATLLLGATLSLSACKKSEEAAPPAPTTATPATGTVGADGVRRIEITASEKGYVPDRIEGKPGEKLVLVFTRTIDGECLEKVKVAGGAEIELPKNKAVDVPVEVPASGEVKFACGMDMFTGVIVAKGA